MRPAFVARVVTAKSRAFYFIVHGTYFHSGDIIYCVADNNDDFGVFFKNTSVFRQI